METIQKNRSFIFLFISILMISCNDISEYNQYKTLVDRSWNANENINFNFEVTDTISPKNLFINIRNNNDYEFSNLYLITALKFPNNSTVIDTLQYEMADETGKFLGNGFSNIKENKLFFKEAKVFPVSGNYSLEIRQAMRKSGEVKPIESLTGIQEVGFSIEKIN